MPEDPRRKRRRRPEDEQMPPGGFPLGMPMGPNPAELFPDSQGRYRSLAGANPSPSMQNAPMPQPIPPVEVTAQSLARRLAMMGGEEGAEQQATQKRKKKSLMDYILELQ